MSKPSNLYKRKNPRPPSSPLPRRPETFVGWLRNYDSIVVYVRIFFLEGVYIVICSFGLRFSPFFFFFLSSFSFLSSFQFLFLFLFFLARVGAGGFKKGKKEM